MRVRYPGCLLTLGLQCRNPPSGEETDLRTQNAFALLGQIGVGDESEPNSASGSQWTEVGAGRRARAQPSQGTRSSATASRTTDIWQKGGDRLSRSVDHPGSGSAEPRTPGPSAPLESDCRA